MKQTYIIRPGETIPLSNLLTWVASRDVERPWKVIVQEYVKDRTAEQNAYYWGVVLPAIQAFIVEHRGENYSCDDIHEWYRDEFLPHKEIAIKGKIKVVRPSTARLTVKEFSEYLERVIHHAAENRIVIPAPEWRDL